MAIVCVKFIPLISLIFLFIGCGETEKKIQLETEIPSEFRERCFPLKLEFRGVYIIPEAGKTVNVDRLAEMSVDLFKVDSTGNDQLDEAAGDKTFFWRGKLIGFDAISDSSFCYRVNFESRYLEDKDTCYFIASGTICLDKNNQCVVSGGEWDIKCNRYNRGGGTWNIKSDRR